MTIVNHILMIQTFAGGRIRARDVNDSISSKYFDDGVQSFDFRMSVDNVATVRGKHFQDNPLVDWRPTAHIISSLYQIREFL